jgi:glycerate kinase
MCKFGGTTEMRIVIAPDSFKGSLTAWEVAERIESGINQVWPEAEIVKIPIADGGEGTVQALVRTTQGTIVPMDVLGPLGLTTRAYFGILGDGSTAVVEMAVASGLPLVPKDKRNPLITTTYGTGQLIKGALDKGCKKLIIGIGGSATNDGGAGMAQALGVKLLDAQGRELGFGGGQLPKLATIDHRGIDPRIADVDIVVACDVDNPLCGGRGASAVYGPQKGATVDMVGELDAALYHYSEIIERDLGKDVRDMPGAGAAGGLGAGLIAFLGAKLRPGIDIVLEATDFLTKVSTADLVITGEGKMDHQTACGKAPVGVARVAKQFGVPVIAIAGGIGDDADVLCDHGIDAFIDIIPYPMELEEAMKRGEFLLERATVRAIRMLQVGRKLGAGTENRESGLQSRE